MNAKTNVATVLLSASMTRFAAAEIPMLSTAAHMKPEPVIFTVACSNLVYLTVGPVTEPVEKS